MIYSGDEFGNSQQGNNNAYCQDNEIFWLNWRDLTKNRRHFEFVKGLLALRGAHPIPPPGKAFSSDGLFKLRFSGSVSPWTASVEGKF